MFVVTQAQIDYHRPARLDDQLLVTASLHASGRASLTIRQQAFLQPAAGDAQAPLLLCEAFVRIGWVDGTSMRPTRIPNSLLEQLS
ncbi:acyl-CoA thioesterase YbgC [compost metagenome]